MLLLTHLYYHRYDSTTGTFTVPSGGDGFYYFSVYLTVDDQEFGRFEIRINKEVICQAYGSTSSSTFTDPDHTTCSGVALATEGMQPLRKQ